MNEKILIIDDEENIVELIKFNLELNGYQTQCAYDGKTGISKIKTWNPDLVLLDIMLPGIDGITIIQLVRSDEKLKHIPIIMMTAKSQDSDKFIGFESGADDYVTKPFIVKELVYRIKAVLKRSVSNSTSGMGKKEIIEINNLTIDFSNYQILKNQKKLELTLKEYELIKYLAENADMVLTRDDILDKVWGYDFFGESRTLDVHIRNIRKKIGDENQGIIETVRGIGYKFNKN
ncbi:response regulator transcription factor [Proteocatella sphenisci]|uniref:response regulator transcription factor n=1 Tax=Proteocatella sphenisci TaxID=181070 RepID=UPI00048F43E7|nr:response regulator transcription factor [Proteocatella sphenisci]